MCSDFLDVMGDGNAGIVSNAEYVPVIQPLLLNGDGHQNSYENAPDYALMAVVSIMVILLCLICFALYSLIGAGFCYIYGKSNRKKNRIQEMNDTGDYVNIVKLYVFIRMNLKITCLN